ncbi:ribonucleotide reductase inhibitor-domain-containing protein [Podospora didyma]|uniref:Ribonucleotide reductase inhibitor-domain-containing protein n=1 Tax=Podospora didyma TaxID=330526 RepID=A0AAE0K8C2_9PEZI|nr:ribonucleotide reductase inhibitor-domain-containing protein [Podospora didyma]
MSAPRTKRQFAGAASDPAQRQITSFFKSSTDSAASSLFSPPSTIPKPALNGPLLPGHVQANLLSVGMRVRKSVPEGYKTGNIYSGFSLWADNNTNDTVPVTPRAPSLGVRRELEPFCGLHRTGGLAVQPSSSRFDDDVDMDQPPSLTSSQESATSTTASEPMARKRTYATDNDTPSDLSYGKNTLRLMAVPKTRKTSTSLALLGQENATTVIVGEDYENDVVAAVNSNDFEDAAFLDYQGLGLAGSSSGGGAMDLE